MSFSLDIKEFAEKTGRDIDQTIRSASVDVFGLIITETPVDEGTLRGNWQASLGSPVSGILNVQDKTGEDTKRKMRAVVNTHSGDGAIYMANNLPYARPIEYGWSRQKAPNGMVRVNILRFEEAINKAIRELP